MKFKLNFKIFVIITLVIVSVLSSIVISIFFANKSFVKYTQINELKKISYLAETLSAYYLKNNGWNTLKKNDAWGELLAAEWSKDPFNKQDNTNINKKDEIITVISKKSSQSNPIWDPLGIGTRISLYDEHKKYIVGQNTQPIENSSLMQIESGDKIIGWLALSKGEEVYQPIDIAFWQNQSIFFFIMGGSFLFILIVIFFLFSKFILTPITRLSEATKKLGHINFSFRVPVESSDEMGGLAICFNDMAQRLEDYERRQKQWLADISHELRTPLSVLICEIDAFKDGIRKPNKASLICLSNEARHLIKLVNDIHDISLIEAKSFSIKKGLLKPLPLLSQEVYLFKELFERNDISVEVDFDASTSDLQIIGDPNRLKQLFSNIFENAIHYTEKPGRLKIKQNCDMDWVRFIFEDSGPGVPDEALPFLFDRLYRVDPSRSRETGGSGLGLAICKSIVEMHNGNIRAQNIKGSGLIIEILLPLDPCGCAHPNPTQQIS